MGSAVTINKSTFGFQTPSIFRQKCVEEQSNDPNTGEKNDDGSRRD